MTIRSVIVVTAVIGGILPASGGPPASPSTGDRAVAFGLLLDTPLERMAVDRAILVADGLRHRYGLDAGDLHAARTAAARRAADELARVVFSRSQIACAARALGERIEGSRCGRRCAATARIAEIELQKATLEIWAGLTPSRPRVERCRARRP